MNPSIFQLASATICGPAILALVATAADMSPVSLIPRPARLTVSQGTFTITRDTVVIATGRAASEARQLAAALRGPTGLPLPVTNAPSASAIALQLDPNLEPQFGTEGYHLSVTPTGIVSARDGAGRGGVVVPRRAVVRRFPCATR